MKKIIVLFTLLISTNLFSQECFIGEVRMFAGNYAPRGWALLHGQLLPISQNTALFSILGTNYGGDGRTTFGVPDMRGRSAIGQGQGPGLTNYRLGEKVGSEKNNIMPSNLPNQNGTVSFSALEFSGNAIEVSKARGNGNVKIPMIIESNVDTDVTLNGGNLPINNMPPSIVINHIICLQGIFPSRS